MAEPKEGYNSGITRVVSSGAIDSDGNYVVGGATLVEVGIPNQRHNRYLTLADGDTWPGDETYKVTWTQAENVRRYRVRLESATADSTVNIVEDAANEAQAEVWLAAASSSASADVEYWRAHNALLSTATTNKDDGWSEWKELSKDSNDLSLSNLYFLGDTNEAYAIWVEAE